MKYTSPLDKLYEPIGNSLGHRFPAKREMRKIGDLQNYKGTFSDTIEGLSRSFEEDKKLSLFEDLFNGGKKHKAPEHVALSIYPARLVKGMLDYKINNPDKEHEFLVPVTTDFSLRMMKNYGQPDEVREILENYNEILMARDPEILERPIKERSGFITVCATNPRFSQSTAERIVKDSHSDDILFISIGHGGIRSGMDTFLRYVDMTKTDSVFYPVRFSRRKKRDETPVLTDSEKSYLDRKGTGRQLVLFDEDIVTPEGGTMSQAKEYFEDLLDKEVIKKVNIGTRTTNKISNTLTTGPYL